MNQSLFNLPITPICVRYNSIVCKLPGMSASHGEIGLSMLYKNDSLHIVATFNHFLSNCRLPTLAKIWQMMPRKSITGKLVGRNPELRDNLGSRPQLPRYSPKLETIVQENGIASSDQPTLSAILRALYQVDSESLLRVGIETLVVCNVPIIEKQQYILGASVEVKSRRDMVSAGLVTFLGSNYTETHRTVFHTLTACWHCLISYDAL